MTCRSRLFLACPLPEGTPRELEAWAQSNLAPLGVRIVPADNLHVTLAFFGDKSSAERDEIAALMSQATWPGLDVATTRVAMSGRSAIAIGLEPSGGEWIRLRDDLGSPYLSGYELGERSPEQLRADAGRFAPWESILAHAPNLWRGRLRWPPRAFHVTLARTKRPIVTLPELAPSLRLSLTEAALYESRTLTTGAEYRELARLAKPAREGG